MTFDVQTPGSAPRAGRAARGLREPWRQVARELGIRSLAGSTALGRELTDVDARLRQPVSTSRRVAVVQVDGGAGGTTTVARLATALARRRRGGVLAVDAAGGPALLARAAGVPDPAAMARLRDRTVGITRSAQAREALPHSAAGLCVLGTGTADQPWPTPPQAWRAAVDPVGRFFDVVVTDWGVRDEHDVTDLVPGHHVLAVVARADRTCAERALTALATGIAAAPGVAAAVVLVDVGGTGGPSDVPVRRTLAELGLPVPVLSVPHDRAVQDPAGPPPAAATRTAYARVGATLLTLAGAS